MTTTTALTTTNPIALTDMNTNTHPIELLIVALLALLEGVCWVINELAGFHTAPALALTAAPAPLALPPAPVAIDPAPALELAQLTVKQLRRLCVEAGLPRATYHAARKQQLIAALA